MRILVTNDDGIESPGLLALVQALRPIASIDVLAPDRNWSAAGHQRTIDRPVRVRSTVLADATPAFTTDGAPTDCVCLALAGVLPSTPSLVIAGINRGSNVGQDVVYSGTIAAATEAALRGVPGIAISLADWSSTRFDAAAAFVVDLVREVERNGLSTDTIMNVNVPAIPAEQIRGVAVTSLGQRMYGHKLEPRSDPFGHPYYWLAAGAPTDFAEPGTDLAALADGFISITPLVVDRTHAPMLSELGRWTFPRRST
jgi:5'-nucleotidase